MKVHSIEEQRPDLSGFKFAAAVVVIGLIIAASEGPIIAVPTVTLHDAAASEMAPAATEYFPSGYTLDVTEPSPHIEAF